MTSNPTQYCVVVVGDVAVGKTTFVKRATGKKAVMKYQATAGFDFGTARRPDGSVLHLWDISGQERTLKNVTVKAFVDKADAFIVMFDITDRISFQNASKWHNLVRRTHTDLPIVLVANKLDLPDHDVTSDEMDSLVGVNSFKSSFICSAVTGTNVEDIVRYVIQLIDEDKPASLSVSNVLLESDGDYSDDELGVYNNTWLEESPVYPTLREPPPSQASQSPAYFERPSEIQPLLRPKRQSVDLESGQSCCSCNIL